MAKQEEQMELAELRLHLKKILGMREGRNVLWNILDYTDIYSDVFSGDNMTFYLEGKRAVGLFLIQQIQEVDPTAYARLLMEFQQEEEENGNAGTDY